jgi:ABC-type Zn uptake system ZnuABC Zn-binding protein ZnuA
MNKILLITLFTGLLSFDLKAQEKEVISCSFHQLCNLAGDLYKEHPEAFKRPLSFDYLVREDIDPHEYTPTGPEIKKLIDAKILLLPRFELQPWAERLKAQRGTKSTFIVPHFSEIENKFKGNQAALAHFWLYPELLCEAKKALAKFFVETIEMKAVEVSCSLNLSQTAKMKIKAALGENTVLILTHDALLPYFEQLGVKTYALKGSHHHDEISPRVIKEISTLISESAKQGTKVVWLYEEEIPVPSQIKNLAKKDHQSLLIKVNGVRDESADQVIKNLGRLIYSLKGK